MSGIMKVAVIGAGITGISCARLLKDAGVKVSIFEKSDYKGGLVRCTLEKNDVLFHRVGGHVFNSKDSEVNDWFWGFFDKDSEFYAAKRRAVIFKNNKFINYPIENSLDSFEKLQLEKIINELSAIISKGSGLDVQTMIEREYSFKDFLLEKFGQTLCDEYFFPYNSKIWNRDLSLMPLEWLLGKLPMPNPLDIITSNIMKADESEMVHSTFYYPKNGGSQFIVERLSENIDIKYNYDALPELLNGDDLTLDGATFDCIIYTGDIRKLLSNDQLENFGISIDATLDCLPSNSTSNLLCKCDKNPYSWVYLADSNISCHRIIMTGNFSPSNNGTVLQDEDKITCTLEFSGEYSYDQMTSQLCKLPFNLEPLAHNIEESSYIIHTSETGPFVSKVSEIFESKNIYLCGRFADWQYYNMDAAISAAMKLVNKILA